jgi:peroxiredoxin
VARRRRSKDARKEVRQVEERGATKAKRTKRILDLGLIVLVISALILVIVLSPRGGPGVNVGQQARDFTVTDTDGSAFRLGAFRGEVVLVDWMGTNCPPCRIQMPGLVGFHEAFRARGLVMISIDMSDFGARLAAESEGEALAFLAEFGAEWPIALERTGLATRYGVVDIPTIMIVDPSGLIVFKKSGVHSFDELSAIVEPLVSS